MLVRKAGFGLGLGTPELEFRLASITLLVGVIHGALCPMSPRISPADRYSQRLRDGFLRKFGRYGIGFVCPKNEDWFSCCGRRYFYKHATARPTLTRSWQWTGLKKLKEFTNDHPTAMVVLEAKGRFGVRGKTFLVEAKKLLATIKGKNSFSIPMTSDSGRPISKLLRSPDCVKVHADLVREFRRAS